MKGMPLCWIALLLVAPMMAGNRADINADLTVNAVDAVLLANIVAGNIDVGNYNLESVVVVALQGGDFTDPADAADWVAAQIPSPVNRFVILVTPGSYETVRSVALPGYTTLQGYGPQASRITLTAAPDGYALCVSSNGTTGVAIRDLSLALAASGDKLNQVICLANCTGTRLENLDLEITTTTYLPSHLFAYGGSVRCRGVATRFPEGARVATSLVLSNEEAELEHCRITMVESVLGLTLKGIDVTGISTLQIRDSSIHVETTNADAFVTCINNAGTAVAIVVANSSLRPFAPTSLHDRYFACNVGTHSARFFCCLLDGGFDSQQPIIWFGCHDYDGVAVPIL